MGDIFNFPGGAGSNVDVSVVIKRDTVIIGTQFADYAREGYTGLGHWGAVYVFQKQAEGWTQVNRFIGDVMQRGFSASIVDVAFDGNTIVLGSDWSSHFVRGGTFYP